MTGHCEKLWLLMWKNCLLQLRHPILTTVAILIPILFSTLYVGMRCKDPPVYRKEVRFTPFFPTIETNKELVFSPTNPHLSEIMELASIILGNISFRSFNSSADMLDYAQENETVQCLIVQFDQSLAGDKSLPKEIYVSLRFPGILQTSLDNWMTSVLSAEGEQLGPRSPEAPYTPDPLYYEEEFLGLQYAVTTAIVLYLDGAHSEIFLQRLPLPAWVEDDFSEDSTLPRNLILFGFIFSFVMTVAAITREKEKLLKESLKLLGISNWLHWVAWFAKTLILLLFTIIIIVILLKLRWACKLSVFRNTNFVLLFILLMSYGIATTTFAFMMSVFFSSATKAAVISAIVFYFSIIPYTVLKSDNTFWAQMLGCLLSNTAGAFGLNIMLMYEALRKGSQWNNLFKPYAQKENLTLGDMIIMLWVDTILYLLIALYVEAVHPGKFGIALPWYFPLSSSYWCGGRRSSDVDEKVKNESEMGHFFEEDPEDFSLGIQIRNLSKSFRKNKVVDNFNLNVYSDQITVILGQNGAGKTTTMLMLIGMFSPTSGTATIAGNNIRTDMKKIRQNLGWCPQHNILFDELTVREHFYFFSKLKGVPKNKIDANMEKYIHLMDFSDKVNTESRDLSGGTKRKLSVGVALCGDSKVVMLDEPTTGMDPPSRKALLQLLQEQKKGRTIFLTTHFMDEADQIGDRIAIIARGVLQCCGSPFFLRQMYRVGDRLVIEKTEECDPTEILNIIKEYITDAQLESAYGSTLVYRLNERKRELFEKTLHHLERKTGELGIVSYGISHASLEDVFLRKLQTAGFVLVGLVSAVLSAFILYATNFLVCYHASIMYEVGTEYWKKDKYKEQEQDNLHDFSEDQDLGSKQIKNYCCLVMNQHFALVLKKLIYLYRSWAITLCHLLVPVVVLVIFFLVAYRTTRDISRVELPELEITLKSYNKSVTIINGTNKFKDDYTEILNDSNYDYIDWKYQDLSVNFLRAVKYNPKDVLRRYIVGATFQEDENDSIVAWFNGELLHSSPLALKVALDAVLNHNFALNQTVKLTNHPLPVKKRDLEASRGIIFGSALYFSIAVIMAIVSPLYIISCIRERASGAKNLQHISGVNMGTYWYTCFICDMSMAFLTTCVILLILVIFQEKSMRTLNDLMPLVVILLCFNYCILPFEYISSFCFESPSNGYGVFMCLGFITGVAGLFIHNNLMYMVIDAASMKVAEVLHYFFLVIPHYSLVSGVYQRYVTYLAVQKACATLVKSCTKSFSKEECLENVCYEIDLCCDVNYSFKWEYPGLGKNLVCLVSLGTVFIILLLLAELKVFRRICYLCNPAPLRTYFDSSEDEDVEEERREILNASDEELKQYAIAIKHLTKRYGKCLAVNDMCLGIPSSECFGLLGVNGAGKTTTFKMLTGQIRIRYGDIWLKGISVRHDSRKIRKELIVSYCPQSDALFDNFSGQENMILFCMIKGFSFPTSKAMAKRLAKKFDFEEHFAKKIKNYSGGNKRKVSVAIAFIGDPQIMFLDEPTTGLDPKARRRVWGALGKARDSGKCVIITSHSMDECESLCTRLGIMVNGTFKCMGSVQHLKNKFSRGYLLTIKTHRGSSTEDVFEKSGIDKFVRNNFPGSAIRQKSHECATYQIEESEIPCYRMFAIMEMAKKKLPIDNYYIGQTSLEQVYLLLAKKQRSPDDVKKHKF